MRFFPVATPALLALVATPAQAEVLAKADNGFVVRVAARVTADPATAWRALIVPSQWWRAQHTFSGDAANLTLDPTAGGCFCEKLPLPKDAAKGERAGGVQHMSVVYANPYKALRLNGALGPLQSEALQGNLTITIKAMDGGSRILFEYVVGGFMRYPVDEIAPAVDTMLSAQLAALATKLGPVASAPSAEALPAAQPETPGVAPRSEVAPQGWSLPPGPGGKPAPIKQSATGAAAVPPPAASLAVKPAAKPQPEAKARPVAKATAKQAASPAALADQKERDEANAAFDALLGGGKDPAPNQ